MREDHSNQVEGVVTAVFGVCPDNVKKMYQFYESKIPDSEQGDFLSLVVIELLDPAVTKTPVISVEKTFKTILERVLKRLFRTAKRLRIRELSLNNDDVISWPKTQQQEQRSDILAAIEGFEPEDVLLVLMKLEGHTLSQIASALGSSTTKIHGRWESIQDRLREKLDREK